MSLRTILLLVLPLFFAGPAATQGIPTEWQVRDLALALEKQLDLLFPAVAQFRTTEWSGAPVAYIEQRDITLRELGYAVSAAKQLGEKPLGLGKAFELHLRVQTIESLIANLAVGARTYQPDGIADRTLDLLDTVAQPRGRLRDYVIDLAASKELEMTAIDAEAQRCRAELLRSPVTSSSTSKKKKSK